jgi:autotransporter-associated beta strand protein
MKLCTVSVAALVVLVACARPADAIIRYWDVNGVETGATPGANGIGDGTWDVGFANWNDQSDGGDGGGSGTITGWSAGDDAVFAAGMDLGTDFPGGQGASVTVTATQSANSVLVEEGYVALRGGTVDTGAGNVTIDAGATLDIDSTLRLNTGAGKVVLNGGRLLESNPGNAGTFLGSSLGPKGIEIGPAGIGYIGYDDGDGIADNKVSIFYGVITGDTGTTGNGGFGTLVKTGPDQIGIGVSDQDFVAGAPFIHSQSLFTFAKLRVDQGAYRLRHQTQDNTVRETAFGAVPTAELADAITLNGGGIGSNTTVTLHAFRGITVTANDGYLDHGATAGLNIPGPLTAAAADHVLNIGSPTSTATNNVTFSLSHANNVNTFQGSINVKRGVLRLDSSLNAANFSGAGFNATTTGTVQVQVGQTFSFGSGGDNTSYDGILAGAGTFRKVGAGTTTFTGTQANTHSGDTRIEGGTLSITQPYLANGGDVYLTTGSTFDLNFLATDVIDSLYIDGVLQEAGIWGSQDSGAAHPTMLITGSGLLDVTTGAVMGVPGDFNEDGKVDAADYAKWRANDGPNAPLPNDNGLATQQERYDLWVASFGDMAGSGSGSSLAAVPEPASMALVIFGLAAFVIGRRGR